MEKFPVGRDGSSLYFVSFVWGPLWWVTQSDLCQQWVGGFGVRT